MDKLTDLELEKRIAVIEGVNYFITKGEAPFVGILSENDFTGTPPELIGKFSPRTDKALLLDLIFKHKVCIDRGFAGVNQGLVEIWPKEIATCDLIGTYSSEFNSEEEFPRAVLECIVEANNG